ncbi:MAG: InlB B-repeat-containing protein [Synergistaceae bacterium]|nr:InlB B-repeat-containing protein [Synergistaceae bacterium]
MSFNTNGGTPATIEAITQDFETSITAPENPTREHYTFSGWSPSIPASMPAQDMTCTAQWTPVNYSITYNMNNGTNNSNNPSTYTIESNAITLQAPTRTGYDFAGWTGSNSSTAQTSVTIAKGSTGNKSYTANWTPITYTISYTLNGGSVSGNNPTSYTIESNAITLNNPTRTGYTFKGWSGTGLNGDSNTSVTIANGSTGNRTYTANWTPIIYTITYDLKGGTVSTNNPAKYTIEIRRYNAE